MTSDSIEKYWNKEQYFHSLKENSEIKLLFDNLSSKYWRIEGTLNLVDVGFVVSQQDTLFALASPKCKKCKINEVLSADENVNKEVMNKVEFHYMKVFTDACYNKTRKISCYKTHKKTYSGTYFPIKLNFDKLSVSTDNQIYLDNITHTDTFEKLPIHGTIGFGLVDNQKTYTDIAFETMKSNFQLNRSIIELKFDEINGYILFGSYSQIPYEGPRFNHMLRNSLKYEIPIKEWFINNATTDILSYSENTNKISYHEWALIDSLSEFNVLPQKVYDEQIKSVLEDKKFVEILRSILVKNTVETISDVSNNRRDISLLDNGDLPKRINIHKNIDKDSIKTFKAFMDVNKQINVSFDNQTLRNKYYGVKNDMNALFSLGKLYSLCSDTKFDKLLDINFDDYKFDKATFYKDKQSNRDIKLDQCLMVRRAETPDKYTTVLGLPFLRSKILRINYENPSIEIISLLRVDYQSDNTVQYELGMSIEYQNDIVLENDLYLGIQITINILLFMLMVTLIFVSTIGYDKYFNDDDDGEES